MQVYPNPDSWDEFYPSEIFIAVTRDDSSDAPLPVFIQANIGTTIALGQPGSSGQITRVYKKVGELETMADFESAFVILSKVGG